MELFAGIAMAFNILIILHKLRKHEIFNAMIDIGAFILIIFMTSGTISGVEIGMIASAIISYYLLKHPISEKEIDEIINNIDKKIEGDEK